MLLSTTGISIAFSLNPGASHRYFRQFTVRSEHFLMHTYTIISLLAHFNLVAQSFKEFLLICTIPFTVYFFRCGVEIYPTPWGRRGLPPSVSRIQNKSSEIHIAISSMCTRHFKLLIHDIFSADFLSFKRKSN